MLVTQRNYSPPKGDMGVEDNRTEQAGYIPPKIQIERMIMAGKRLDEYKKEMYDFAPDDKVKDPEVVEVREPNYDLADAFKATEGIKERKEAKEAAQNKEKAESLALEKQKAEEAEKKAEDAKKLAEEKKEVEKTD